MKIKKNQSWKDEWIDKSTTPMTEMFYKVFGRLPTKKELEWFIDIFIVPKSQKDLEREFRELKNYMYENEKKGDR